MRPSILLTLCVVLFSIGTAMGQCHLRPASASQLTVDEAHRLIAQNKTYRDGDSVITIPVVFHVLHQRGVENISYAQILDAIDHLNKDFRALNTDLPMVIPQFQDVIGDARIEFKLATKDAEGNCTNGVERIRTVQTLLGRLTSYTNQWPRDRYLNVWTHRLQPGAMPGPGPFPPPEVDTAAIYDGVLRQHDRIGTIGTSNPAHAHVLTHDIGHYLGLIHTWGEGEVNFECGDDGIDDTPSTKGFLNCPALQELYMVCDPTVAENFQNFMEYSYCTRMFTEGQCERMWATLASSEDDRNNLGTLANLEITGCTEASHTTCAPEADFYAMVGTNIADPVVPFSPTTCTGTTVLFHDNSSGTSPTSWQWSFQDGEPATSTEQHPTVTFDTPGWKEVNLTVSNAFGSSTLVDTTTIWIGDAATSGPPQLESFEAFDELGNGWIVANNDENHTRWQLHTGAGCMGNASLLLNSGDRDEANFINPTNDRDIDDLITPMMDFSDVTSGLFTFCWSYGAYEAPAEEITERLEVRYSINCGRTWTQFFPVPPSTIQGTNLISNAGPTDPEVWQEHTLPLPATLLGQPTVRFRFRFISGPHSGHLYLDNIGVTNSTAVTELAGSGSPTIMPNPAQGTFTVVHPTLSAGTHGVELFDMRGALVHRIGTVSVPGGSLSLDTRSMGLHAGVYVVQVSGDRDRSIGRLVVH